MNEDRLNHVLADYIRRRDAGEAIDVEALCRSHPDLADTLRSYARAEGRQAGLVVDAVASQLAETIRPGVGRRTDFSPNSMFGRYRIVRLLGEGAMGAIYLAVDTNLDRQVALKIPKFSALEGEFRRRFARESRAAARLDHPNICRVYDADEFNGTPFISMAYVDGQPLSGFIGSQEFKDQRRVATVVQAIAAGLAHAHKQGILHRDLKPSNVLLQPNDMPCITDFGLARRVDAAEETRLTHEGTILGTPAYMSPEQVEGKAEHVGPATDIYALGVVFYELLTGQLPFRGSVMSILGQVLRDRPAKLSKLRADISPELADLCLRMLEKSPVRRPASMDAVASELDQWLKKLAPQTPAAREQSTLDRLEELKGKILADCERGQFAAAVAGLEKMASIKSPDAAQYVAWARQQLPEVKKRPQQLRESVPKLLATAQECMQRQDYAQAAELLQGIPQDFRTEPVQAELSRAIELQEESDLLLTDLQDCVQRRQYEGIDDNLKRYLEIKPGSKFARDLRDALKSYGKVAGKRRTYKHDEKGRLLPMSTASLWDSWLLWGAVCFAVVFGAMTWAITIYLNHDDRTVAVEVDEQWLKQQGGQISLVVDGDSHTITGSGIDISIGLGEHRFSVRQGDTIVYNPQSFTIEKGKRQILRINNAGMSLDPVVGLTVKGSAEDSGEWKIRRKAQDDSRANESGWVDLFNGRDLAGWEIFETTGPQPVDQSTHTKATGGWEVDPSTGILTCTTDKGGWLKSQRQFKDFELQLEFNLEKNGNTGVLVRCPGSGHLSLTGMEIQIVDSGNLAKNAKQPATGSIQYSDFAVRRNQVKSAGQWNSMAIRCAGDNVQVTLNGAIICDAMMSVDAQLRDRPRSGFIGLYNWMGQARETRFRNIRVRDVSDRAPWTPLFNGRDLAGWKPDDGGAWEVRNGVIQIEPARIDRNTHLWSDAQYDDFELRMQFRMLNDEAMNLGFHFGLDNGGINLGPQLELGYFAKRGGLKRMVTGGMYALIDQKPVDLAYITENQRATLEPLIRDHQWVDLYLRCEGQRMIAEFDGLRTINYVDSQNQLPRSGKLGFYAPSYAKGAAEFRNIRVRRIDAANSPPAVAPQTASLSAKDWSTAVPFDFSASTPENLLTLIMHTGHGPKRDLVIRTRPTTTAAWSPPMPITELNTPFDDLSPCLSAFGGTLIFESTRPGGLGKSDLWSSTRASSTDLWSSPVNMGPSVNSSGVEGLATLSADGRTLIFASIRSGGLGGCDFWTCRRSSASANDWSPAVGLGSPINTPQDELAPLLSTDGLELFFTSSRPGSRGYCDLWVTRRATLQDGWSEPENLGPAVNSNNFDYGHILSPDGRLLLFNSDRNGADAEDGRLWATRRMGQ